MRLIRRAGKALGVAEQWRSTYCPNGVWLYGPDKQIVHEALVALGDAPSPNAVDKAIGNSSWTSTRCDECGTVTAENILMLGEEPDYESATVHICAPCLFGAAAYMREEIKGVT